MSIFIICLLCLLGLLVYFFIGGVIIGFISQHRSWQVERNELAFLIILWIFIIIFIPFFELGKWAFVKTKKSFYQ